MGPRERLRLLALDVNAVRLRSACCSRHPRLRRAWSRSQTRYPLGATDYARLAGCVAESFSAVRMTVLHFSGDGMSVANTVAGSEFKDAMHASVKNPFR